MADRPPELHAEMRRVADRLNNVAHRTLTQRRVVATQAGPSSDGIPRSQLTFRQGGPVLAPLRSSFGQLGLYVGQILQARSADEEGAALVVVKYRHALHAGLGVVGDHEL